MSFWANQRWIREAVNFEVVSGFNENHGTKLKDGCYKLAVGDEIILSASDSTEGSAYRRLTGDEEIRLRPGQFAYLITAESIRVPFTVLGFINVATKFKLEGIVNISGFHVDPGYCGKLIFTVFNASPSDIVLHRGLDLFRLWLCDMDGAGGDSNTRFDHLPKDLAKGMKGSYSSAFALAERISYVEKTVESLRISRLQVGLGIIFIALFLLPFVAGLYANLYSEWMSPRLSNILGK